RCGAVMGVIYTEFDISETGAIRSKLSSFLSMPDVLGPELLKRIKITFHIFPEHRDGGRSYEQPDLKLYPEVPKKNHARKNALRLKRALDITGSVIALIIFLPLFIIIPALVKLSSKGPVLFRQTRVGERGRPFTFLKFRSMHINGDEHIHSDYVRKLILEEKAYKTLEGGAGKIYKIKDDPRVTPLGRWLRRTSLDELPQFFNVIKGDMSLVGPRPPIPYELENYDAWHLRRVVEAKPGITGLWQVRGRSLTTFSEMVRMDISYINGWSLWLDIKLILLTPWSMLTSRGAC
ncbi:MAG: sugar transferase, partial [Deltaproteobacteria bacterium]|nr:sugar transferase [Deltaproteobacteria bacterium]